MESDRRTLRHGLLSSFLAVPLMVTTFGACTRAPDSPKLVFSTEYGLGPDKWASAWLLKHLNPGSQLNVTPFGAPLDAGIPFDVPAAEIRRIANRSTFEVVRERYRSDDPVLDELEKIVYDIEVNYWSNSGPAEADAVENAFRQLQVRYGRDAVSASCYIAFFDRVYDLLQGSLNDGIPISEERLDMTCGELERLAAGANDLIPEVPIVDVLAATAAGKKVVFVDVREADEFAENHIPGALNVQLRDVRDGIRHRFEDADLVVSYCVKDFRGFEMAKALSDAGVKNSVIMRPYGIKGWITMGLPVSGAKYMSDADGLKELERCLGQAGGCVSAVGGT